MRVERGRRAGSARLAKERWGPDIEPEPRDAKCFSTRGERDESHWRQSGNDERREMSAPTPKFTRGMQHSQRKGPPVASATDGPRSEEHTSELQSLMRISYAVICLKQKKQTNIKNKRERDTTNKL